MQEQLDYYKAKLQFEMDPSDLYQAWEAGENVIAIDARQTFGYDTEHIPTSVNIPHREMTAASTAHLDRAATYVCYCDGIGCNGSTKGALKMTKLGFKVKELIGGLEWWKFDGYATEGSKAKEGSMFQCAC